MTEQQLPDFQPPPAIGQSGLERALRTQQRRTNFALQDTPWQGWSYGAGFTNFGGGNRLAAVRKKSGEVIFRGLVLSSGTAGGAVLMQLSPGWIPGENEWTRLGGNTGNILSYVNTAGQFIIYDALVAGAWIDLKAMRFFPDQ